MNASGYVYCLETPIGIKIGKTIDPKRRYNELARYYGGNPRFEVSNSHIQYSKTEYVVHKYFDKFRIKSTEAFNISFDDAIRKVNEITELNKVNDKNIITKTNIDNDLIGLKSLFFFINFGKIYFEFHDRINGEITIDDCISDIITITCDGIKYKGEYIIGESALIDSFEYTINAVNKILKLDNELESISNIMIDYMKERYITPDILSKLNELNLIEPTIDNKKWVNITELHN